LIDWLIRRFTHRQWCL